jgi:hypothetical protein
MAQRRVRFNSRPSNEGNTFSQIPKKFNISASDFPELMPNTKSAEKSKTELEYKKMVLTEKKADVFTNNLKPGNVELSFDKHTSGNVMWKFPPPQQDDFYEKEETFEMSANRAINKIIQNWYDYRTNYNIEYGEGAYETLYGYESPDESEDSDSESYYSENDE